MRVDFQGETECFNTRFLKDLFLFRWDDIEGIIEFLKKKENLPWLNNQIREKKGNDNLIKISSRGNENDDYVLLTLIKFCLLINKQEHQVVTKEINNADTNKNKIYELAVKKENHKLNIYYPVDIPIRFDYSTFRMRARFIGTGIPKDDLSELGLVLSENPPEPLELGLVSFKGVDLDNVEFGNVKWLEKKELFFITRNAIVDEMLMDKEKYKEYQYVSKIYNQLRKNYESRLLFNEASYFFVGEMEAIRKSLLNRGKIKGRLLSFPYWLYKLIALYGENTFLPLVIWTPIVIGIFVAWRFIAGECSLQSIGNVISPHVTQACSPKDFFIDSLAAYFQFPRSTINPIDTLERIVSIPILGTAFIAVRRKFERVK